MIQRYGERTDFLQSFNPDLQMKVCHDTELCLFGDAPTLASINMVYGPMTAAMWLVPQLYNLSEYCGCKGKLESRSLEECASVIASDFFFLKVTELMLFFHRFKTGQYGRFYGSVDPLVITTSLRLFVTDRNNEIVRKEDEEHQEQMATEREGCVTFEQWCAMSGKPKGYNPFVPIKQTKPKYRDQDEMLKMAEFIEMDSSLSEETKMNLTATFQKKYGVTPKSVIEKSQNLQAKK